MILGNLNPSESYLYHYTKADALASIIESGVLRVTSYLRNNDPMENGPWSITTRNPGGTPEKDMVLFSDTLRTRVKSISFALDASVERDDQRNPWNLLYRGWARARMWSQYAAEYTGACLIFDRLKLDGAFDAHADEYSLQPYKGEVSYVDKEISKDARTFESGDVISAREESDGQEALVDRHIAEHWNELFFRKTLDWQTESEYRYLFVSGNENEEVRFGDALVGIVLGSRYPETEDSLLDSRLVVSGHPNVLTAFCDWLNGVPSVINDGTDFTLRPRIGP